MPTWPQCIYGPIYTEAGLSIPRRAYPSRGGPIHPEAGLPIPRRAYPSRGGPVCSQAGLSVPRRAYSSRGGPIHFEAGLSVPKRACLSRGGPNRPPEQVPVSAYVGSSKNLKDLKAGLYPACPDAGLRGGWKGELCGYLGSKGMYGRKVMRTPLGDSLETRMYIHSGVVDWRPEASWEGRAPPS